MRFIDYLHRMDANEITELLRLCGIDVIKKYRNKWECTCPIGGEQCSQTSRTAFFLNTGIIHCLHAGHGQIRLYDLLEQNGYKPFSLIDKKNYQDYKTPKKEYQVYTQEKKYNKISPDFFNLIKKDTVANQDRMRSLLKTRNLTESEIDLILKNQYILYLTRETKRKLNIKNANSHMYELGFPTRNKDGLTGFSMWIGEKNPDDWNPKYKYTPNSNPILFDVILNKNDKDKRLFIIEGAFDTIKLLVQMELNNICLPYAIASIPSSIRINKLYSYDICDNIFLFADQDTAGNTFIINNAPECDKPLYAVSWSKKYQSKGVEEFINNYGILALKEKIKRIK